MFPKFSVSTLAFGLTLLLGVAAVSCNPYENFFEDIESAETWEKKDKSPAPAPSYERLLIMNWNLKFAGGRIDFFHDCFGDRVNMSRSEVIKNLDGLLEKINQVNPDIIMLQEVDIRSKRVAGIDMIQYLLDRTQFNYAVYASQWRSGYVPSPDLVGDDAIGEIDSGTAILSRWPIHDGVRIKLADRTDISELENQFYLHRNILKARLEVPFHEDLHALAVHTEAYNTDGTKKKHIDRFYAEMEKLKSEGKKLLAGGDLNALPPGTVKLKGFPDSVCKEEFIADDYSAETEWLVPLYANYSSAMPLDAYKADNTPWFTHTVDGKGFWNRTLDHMFTNLEFTDGLVHQSALLGGMETMPLSDHAPLTAILDIRGLRFPNPYPTPSPSPSPDDLVRGK